MNWEFRLIWRTLTRYYLPQRVLTKRWLTALILLPLFTGYLLLEVLTWAQQLGGAANIWDVVNRTLNDRLWVHHGLTNILIYLLSEIALLYNTGPTILVRTRSRWAWFVILVLCVVVTVLVFSVLLALVLFGVTTPILPFSFEWSSAAAPLLAQQGLSATLLFTAAPLPTTVSMLTLLVLAWTSLGLVVAIVTLKTQSAIYGFVFGVALNYSAFLLWLAELHFPFVDAIWFHQRMFFWQTGETVNSLVAPFVYGLGYWSVWLVVSGLVLWGICRNFDLVAKI